MLRLKKTEKYDMMWYNTALPVEMIDIIEKDLFSSQQITDDTLSYGWAVGKLNPDMRQSKIKFITAQSWIGGLCYYYVQLANKNCFEYNIDFFQGDTIQYTTYSEGEFYDWHTDMVSPTIDGKIRKLSFTLQLSSEDEYEGGEVQLLQSSSNELLTLPKERGVISIFDSNLKHRVRKIKRGKRKSLVGWVEGPKFV